MYIVIVSFVDFLFYCFVLLFPPKNRILHFLWQKEIGSDFGDSFHLVSYHLSTNMIVSVNSQSFKNLSIFVFYDYLLVQANIGGMLLLGLIERSSFTYLLWLKLQKLALSTINKISLWLERFMFLTRIGKTNQETCIHKNHNKQNGDAICYFWGL